MNMEYISVYLEKQSESVNHSVESGFLGPCVP